ncbi:MAG: four helix bundle protein [Bacteroidota bacterium]
MQNSPLKDKSYSFAIKIVLLCKELQRDKREFIISKQLLRSGTSIGALIREGEFAQSRADFANKMNIALKEANETDYWLTLLHDTEGLALSERIIQLRAACKQLIAMLVSTLKTVRSHVNS